MRVIYLDMEICLRHLQADSFTLTSSLLTTLVSVATVTVSHVLPIRNQLHFFKP